MAGNLHSSTLIFFVNGRKIEDAAVDPECTLLSYLRNTLRLSGTKLGCGEGGCGACTVMISRYHRDTQDMEHYSANACLTPVVGVHGLAVTTVEGIGSTSTKLHAVQERIAKAHGSQCGFCTPGMVMSMYTLLRNQPTPSMEQLEEHLTGNLCRCTGYRPILEGFRSLTTDAQTDTGGCSKTDCCRKNGAHCVGATANGLEDGAQELNHSKYDPNNRNGQENYKEVKCEGGRRPCHHLYNPEDFIAYDPSQDIIFPPELKVRNDLDNEYLEIRGARMTYHRPTSLSHLLQLKAEHPDARIIVGNTEIGIEMKLSLRVPRVLINPSNIPELHHTTQNDKGVTLGAALTLTALHRFLTHQIHILPEHQTRTMAAVVEMLRWFGGVQIRNTASLGGNIMTSSPISDLNPILLAAGAVLSLRSSDGGQREVMMDEHFFTGYRSNVIRPDEVLISIYLPYTAQDEYLLAYKQSRRRHEDRAIVSAAFRVTFNPGSNTVRKSTLAFSGMGPTTVLAPKTMKSLEGREWDASLLEEGTSLLVQELQLPPSAPGGMTQYRLALTVSFFFKFYLGVRELLGEQVPNLVDGLSDEERRAIHSHTHAPPSSTQLFDKVPEDQPSIDPIGRPKVHISALKQATGEAVYVDDIPEYSHELYAALVKSSRAHAKILAIDETKALEMQGVEGFFCHRDLPGDRNWEDETQSFFACGEVVCVGQVVGVVVARDKTTAQKAASLVTITYQDLPPIITIQDAIREDSFWGKPVTIRLGHVEAVLQASPHVLEGEVHVGGQEHFYLETHSNLAVPCEDEGEITLFTSAQDLTLLQKSVAKALGVSWNKVVCRVKRIGGGFGGKSTSVVLAAVPLCVAANKLKRPVRIMLDRDEDMLLTGGRHPMLCKWRAGFTSEGELTGLEVDLFSNAGCTLQHSLMVMMRAMTSTESAYRFGAMRVTGHVCKTHLPSNVAYRGFGAPQATLCAEDIISRVAAFLNMDPLKVRERNLNKTGDVTIFKHVLQRCTVGRCWTEVLDQACYLQRKAAVAQYNRENRYRKRGLSVVPMKHGMGFDVPEMNQRGIVVLVYLDGSVLLTISGAEMGQGLYTKMIQVASRALNIPSEWVHIAETSTDKVPNTCATAASMSSNLNGMAILDACNKLNCRLQPVIAKNPQGSWKEWVTEAYMEGISLSAIGFYGPVKEVTYNLEKNEGHLYNTFSYGTAVTEVEVDCLTGDHTVLRTDIVMDVGDSLNPALDIGQVEGAFVQGQGLFTLEELEYTPEGSLITRGPGQYKIPGVQDIPREFNVSLLRGAPNPGTVFSSKGVGEPPLCLAVSVFCAIKEAVSSARVQAGLSPVFRMDSPATAERIRMACPDFLTKKINPVEPGSFKPWSITV